MEMILIWVLAPAILLALSYSFGLGISILLRKPLGFPIAVVMGFSTIVIVGSLFAFSTLTAPHSALIIAITGRG